MFTFQSSSQNIIVLVIKLLSAMSSSSIWSILMLWLVLCQPPFFFASWLPIRFCHRDTGASAKKTGEGRKEFCLSVCLFLLALLQPWPSTRCSSNHLQFPGFSLLLEVALAAMSASKLAFLPQGLGQATQGSLRFQRLMLTLQHLPLKFFGSRSAGSFL